jgi:hypothetical protein
MKIRYDIKSCVKDQFAAVATIGGAEQEVIIPGLVIEAVSEDGSMGHTFRCRGTADEIEAAFQRASEGGDLFVTLTVGDPDGGKPVSLTKPLDA